MFYSLSYFFVRGILPIIFWSQEEDNKKIKPTYDTPDRILVFMTIKIWKTRVYLQSKDFSSKFL